MGTPPNDMRVGVALYLPMGCRVRLKLWALDGLIP